MKKIMVVKFAGILILTLQNAMAFASVPQIRNVRARQPYPWDGKVYISYEVVGDVASNVPNGELPFLAVVAKDKNSGSVHASASSFGLWLYGDAGVTEGHHMVAWNVEDQGVVMNSSNVIISVSYETMPMYCVIDLSGGADALSYPVTYMAEPPRGGFNVNLYKTTKLVLRLIEAGTFIMGKDQDDESHRVTLTSPFFCGVFEVTQRQYELVTGEKPSSSLYGIGDSYPVNNVSYYMIRGNSDGAKWPLSSSVDMSSFMGKLRARTGLDFDLPTEAQWEYACRAGTTTTYSYGDFADGNYMWYEDNSGGKVHPVGTTIANPWGLYDMHGNMTEWCLDLYGDLVYGTNPKGPVGSGGSRVFRGGRFASASGGGSDCSSFYRWAFSPSDTGYFYLTTGFRIVRTLSE